MKCATYFLAVTATTVFASQPEFETVYWDTVLKNGNFAGGNLQLRTSPKDGIQARGLINVETLIDNGPPSNRIDMVFVGDGYRDEDLNNYEIHVNNAVDAFFSIEPLQSYLPLFNVHRVDVISNESGVDNDPVEGILRDTALNMSFWCSGIERLLCVDTSLAWSYANNVPSTDSILAVANSSMYGGAGYSWAEVGTFSGANASATDVAIHELGHSLADLADEYDYGGPAQYPGDEPTSRNASTYTSTEMAANGTKWANWLGENDPAWDGFVSTYEGAVYSQYGIYRPTNNSMMRSLNRPFNQPSAEGFIIEMYKIVDPLDDHTPHGVIYGPQQLFITPVELAHPMEIHWYLNGFDLNQDGVTNLDLSLLSIPAGNHTIEVTVVDPTDWVRDEAARDSIMKQTVSWLVVIDELPCAGDLNEDGVVGIADLLTVIEAWGDCDNCSADLNSDGVVNVSDLLTLVDAWGICP